MDETLYFKEILQQRGWFKRWSTQVMADILLPLVQQQAEPEKNAPLSQFKQEENNMLALYMVKEFLNNVGLKSTGKIFEAEAGIVGIEQDFQPVITEQFTLLKPATSEEVQPPLLSQALQIWKIDALERQAANPEPQGAAEMTSSYASSSLVAPARSFSRTNPEVFESAHYSVGEEPVGYRYVGHHTHPDPLAGLICRRGTNGHRSMNCKRCS